MPDTNVTPDDVFEAVERAIDLLAAGDARAAASEYRRLAAKAPRAPEVVVLEGMLASHDGAPEDALRAFEKAASLDVEYALPLVLAAETCLVDLNDPDRCLELCASAAKITDTDDARAEILLLEANAWVELDKDAEVRKRIGRLASLDLTDPDLSLRAGDLALEFEDFARARTWYKKTIELEPDTSHAWHGLGVVHEAVGEREPMIEAWLKTLELDHAAPPAPWHLSRDAFEREVEKALLSLPQIIRDKLADVAVLVEDAPSEDLVREGADPRLLGLFSGTPTTDRGTLDAQPTDADTIRIYQRNVEMVVDDGEHLLDEIRITLIHETAHYFGLEDEDLEGMGLG